MKTEPNDPNYKSSADTVSIKHELIEKYDHSLVKSDESDDFFNEPNSRFPPNKSFTKQEEIDIKYNNVKFEIQHTEVTDNNKNIIREFSCGYCDYKTSSRSYFKIHTALHEDPTKLTWYCCSKCSYKTRQSGHLKRHDLNHSEAQTGNMFHCTQCDSSHKTNLCLLRHLRLIHHSSLSTKLANSDCKNVYSCDKCSYTTTNRGLLTSHFDKHKDLQDVSGLYICEVCSFRTKYRRNLRVHLQTHKDDDVLKVFACKICSFKTRIRNCLKRHLLSRRHLLLVGKLHDYRPRGVKLSQGECS
ncbi:RE1-silencing transcription factor B-like [Euwallacea fornicatus]|uniref:RE1-silencing transcription factor B-like n=1 Tax=Euwallacea fornicatus TaxID=995702 RepID=UPI00338EE1E8